MPRDEAKVIEIAERIADGDQVDWDAAISEAPTESQRLMRLRELAKVGDAHRDMVEETGLPFPTWGPLGLLRPVDVGGFGEVFLAHDRNLDCSVALKLLAREDSAFPESEFVQEARKLASVKHENVVAVRGVDRHRDRVGIWMEWIDGETLDTVVRGRGSLAAGEAALIGVELCRALAAVHAAGLVHRDVKLANVMRERRGRIVLMDFGSSTRSVAPGAERSGTPPYLPPEAFRGQDSGKLVDIYALGVALYRLVSGAYPVEATSVNGFRVAHDEGRRVDLRDRNPDLPAAFVRIVERAIDPDPAGRFQTVGEMERELARFLGAPVAEVAAPVASPVLPRRWLVAAAAILVVGLAAWGLSGMFAPALNAEAVFFRLGEDAGVEQRLADGVTVGPGDRLFLELRLDRKAWVYIVNADARGEQNLLFPVEGLQYQNPVPEGLHRMPGLVNGKEQFWEVTSTGGDDRLLVVASRRPLEFVEEEIAGLQTVVPGKPIRIADASVGERLRGIAGIAPAPEGVEVPRSSAIQQIRTGVAVRSGKDRGIRSWELTLPNPG